MTRRVSTGHPWCLWNEMIPLIRKVTFNTCHFQVSLLKIKNSDWIVTCFWFGMNGFLLWLTLLCLRSIWPHSQFEIKKTNEQTKKTPTTFYLFNLILHAFFIKFVINSACVQRDMAGVLLSWMENDSQCPEDIKEKLRFNALPLQLFPSLALGQNGSKHNERSVLCNRKCISASNVLETKSFKHQKQSVIPNQELFVLKCIGENSGLKKVQFHFSCVSINYWPKHNYVIKLQHVVLW